MKIGRNSLCPCGSGRKYKYCCMNKQRQYVKDGLSVNEAIRSIVRAGKYSEDVGNVLCNLMNYMRKEQWIGACHATTAVMFVALSELGYDPIPCIGEVKDNKIGYFDHSWLKLDGKIIDLACSMTLLQGRAVNAPVILDVDIYSGQPCAMEYGVYYCGLDNTARHIANISLSEYMDGYPRSMNGLWDVVNTVFVKKLDISTLRSKYQNTQWKYVL